MRIRLDAREYSRYGQHQIGATLIDAPIGNPLTVALVRLDGYGDVITQTVTPATASAFVPFDLRAIETHLDTAINWCRQGSYAVVVRDAADTELARSRVIPVRTVPLAELKTSYLFGVPLHAEATLMPITQPALVTGARVTYVDPGMFKGTGALTWNPGTRLLSWRGGSGVVVGADDLQTVALLTPEQDAYLEVEIDPDLLPDAATVETLIIDNWRLTDDRLAGYLARAYDAIQMRLQLQLETTIVTTRPQDAGYYDVVADARIYERGKLRTIPLETPLARPLRRVLSLTGWYADQQSVDIPAEWITIDERAALVSLVPVTGTALISSTAATYLYGAINRQTFVPHFWHFRAVSGLPALDGDHTPIREALATQAALYALQDLSLAATTGRTSRSASREGVSENWNYSPQGAYSEKIAAYQGWLDTNLPKLRQRFAGPNVVVM